MSVRQVARQRVEQVVGEVLARDEFGTQDAPSALGAFGEWLGSLFEHSEMTRGLAGPVALAVGIGLSMLFTTALVRLWLTRAARRDPARATARGAPPRAQRPELVREARDWVQSAERALAEGDMRRALSHYFTALVVALGAAGQLDYDDAWTNRELLVRGRPAEPWGARLERLVERNEAKSFGPSPTSRADVDELRELCARLLSSGGPS